MPNGSLVVYHVSSEDSGKYTCIAGNACNIIHRDTFLYVVGEFGSLHCGAPTICAKGKLSGGIVLYYLCVGNNF